MPVERGAPVIWYKAPMAEMAERAVKRAEPLTTFEQVFPSDLNPHGTMFGGLVVALMDKCAGLCVARWSGRVSVTASIDAIQFKTPIRQGQMVEAVARVIFVSRTSCVVRVQVFAHNLQAGLKEFCCEGYFNMVGIDPDGHPALLPLIPHETPEEQADWEHGAEIHAAMLKRRGRNEDRG